MKYVTPTIYGGFVNNFLLFNKPLDLPDNCTLNEKFNVQSTLKPSVNERPTIDYIAIGIGGVYSDTGVDGLSITKYRQHLATDAALFRHIPFVLRPVGSDLTVAERAKYRMRVPVTISGTQYYAYYMKKVSTENFDPQMKLLNRQDGVTTISQFTPTTDNLNPTPSVLSNTGVNTVDGDFVVSSVQLDLSLTAGEVQAIVDAVRIIYGSDEYAKISEVAICAGVDRVVSGTANGASINYTESIATVVHTHYTTEIPLLSTSLGYEERVDVGSTSPMFNIS